jgi:uncharacterized protein (DUF305 family)
MTKMPMVDGMQMPAEGGHAKHGRSGSPLQTTDMAADVEKLRTAPEPFDRAFIDAMIPHHQDAIEASKAAATRASWVHEQARRKQGVSPPIVRSVAAATIADAERPVGQLAGVAITLG